MNKFLIFYFFIVHIALLIYSICNWREVILFQPFNGNSLIFCTLILWTFLPFLNKVKIKNIEGTFNNPLYQNKEEAEQKLTEIANQTPNINVDVNIQNKYNNEITKIMTEKGVANDNI